MSEVRIWSDPEAIFDRLVALTPDAVLVGNPSAEELPKLVEALEQGQAPRIVLKDVCDIVEIADLKKVKWDQKSEQIDFYWGKGDTRNIDFDGSAIRDDFAVALTEVLADFDAKTVEFSKLRAAVAPMLTAGVAVPLTWLLQQAALALEAGDEVEVRGRHGLMKRALLWTIDAIGPTGVLIVGGLVVLACGWKLLSRMDDPPIITTLKRP